MTKPIIEKLNSNRLFFDGAVGTILQKNGLQTGEQPELWNLTQPQFIRDIHEQYLDAGCNILKTNTFGANAIKLKGTSYSVSQVVSQAVRIAKTAIEASKKEAYIALDIGPSGKLLQPFGDLPFDDAYNLFAEVVEVGKEAGADLILLETFIDTYELKAAILAAKEHSDLPIFVTMTFDEKGRLLTGGSIASAYALAEGLGVNAFGFNCGLGPIQMEQILPELLAISSLPIILNPNAGLPQMLNGEMSFDITPAQFAASMRRMADDGALILGGCCGTDPSYLSAMIESCKEVLLPPIRHKNISFVSSASKAIILGESPLIIGERINPTGKPRLKQALREEDMDFILQEGFSQQENGAHILDVNVGLPDIDEARIMAKVIKDIQSVIDLPLQIDTSNLGAMEKALRVYNGKPLLNSVNGKKESMEAVFPLAKHYGAVIVALTLDESGIPETAEGRLDIARKILNTAATYGIDRKDIIVDPLTLTISTGQDAAQVTLQSLALIKKELLVNTVLGVSNVSFGLPQREKINHTFLTMALQQGLDAAIINPNSAVMTASFDSYLVLAGLDPQCAHYIEKHGQSEDSSGINLNPSNGELDLFEAIIKGMKERAHEETELLLGKNLEPLEIINQKLIPALDWVGKGFESGKLFLPQLLMSAEAAKSSFEAIKSYMSKKGMVQTKRDKIILATVKGDIHDIGKNIVKVLLENYGYDVIDLGKDVAIQKVVDAAKSHQVKLVGLSALMTTTVVNMAKTIQQLRIDVPECSIMVGGAVLTQSYADQIGADYYAKDAMAAVHYAKKIFQ